jgi:catechol 2,3-dioxygenase-like lactoylglutathione lyase family enzyme
MRLAQAMLFVTDMARMQGFYRDVLGLAVLEEGAGFSRYDAGGAVLALHAIPAEHAPTIGSSPAARDDTPIKLTFEVGDVAATRARLVAAQIAMRAAWEWNGLHACDGVDPEGNVFQIASRAA